MAYGVEEREALFKNNCLIRSKKRRLMQNDFLDEKNQKLIFSIKEEAFLKTKQMQLYNKQMKKYDV